MERSRHTLMRTVTQQDGTKSVEVWTPEKVISCRDKDELEAKLKHYGKLLMQHHTPDSIKARRKYVELIRPALRYYCKRYGVTVPKWLANDTYYTEHLSVEDKLKQFGERPLRIHEFRNMRGRARKPKQEQPASGA